MYRTNSYQDRERKHRRGRPAKPPSPSPAKDERQEERVTRSPQSGREPAKSKEESVKSREKLSSRSANTLPPPLTAWPPAGLNNSEDLSREAATRLIAAGAPIFEGTKRSIPHASDEYYNLYAACKGNGDTGGDCGDVFTGAFEVDSMSIHHSKSASHPWETLEQPSMAFYYGTRGGEITLNHWISMSRHVNPPIELRDPGVKPREVELSTILNRLIYLENGFEEDYEDLMYKNLYGNLLRDPDKYLQPHKSMVKQIADLILVLSRPEWIDFSLPQNQIVAKFFATASYSDQGQYKMFFHQLLLSMELDNRIHSNHYTDHEKEMLMSQLPPSIAWNLAVARKWRECIKIEKFSADEKGKRSRFCSP